MKNNLLNIEKNIEEVLKRSGRTGDKVHIIAVTKTVGVDKINEAIELGLTNIGENRTQELVEKYDIIGNKAKYHMIGHLQTNKVKTIIDKVALVHSLDRLSLAKELDKRAKKHGIIVDTLVQVNVAEEESKFGLKLDEVIPFLEKILKYDSIRVKGLMTIAPFVEDAEEVRWVFKELRRFSEVIKNKDYTNVKMEILSMGMTNDYQVAIEEGSNMIRIGTGIFGQRKYR
ncbi:YggS family pyridoxal phosphate-dependent enzyme [Schnuerera ultunensis]|uniref:YggS family pyridoxal phosphate-dependent enzyme n=1 Tax=Schnuerera ultunensis TaxID=45497 RepID=UPI000685DF29|nr:YggS family pyridoxal phosphate-dependent enzyme [Schnuerera ultunensis]